jgi:signal transduction histidine kinase
LDKTLLFASPLMEALFKGEPHRSLVNPTFDQLIAMKSSDLHVFEGLMTMGDLNSINRSISAHVFIKDNKMLIVGGADTLQLLDQNSSMHRLNSQISNLQRELLKEKHTLQNTLEQLNEANAALKEAIAIKDKFFSIIAHDLRSPFNSIIGLSHLLLDQVKINDLEGIDTYAQIILNSSNSAMDLLSNLMEWSRSQTGRMDFRPEDFDFFFIVKNVIELMQSTANHKSIQIESTIPPDIFVYADKAMTSTVLRNLISNAIKFTQPNGHIALKSSILENEVVISVIDNGVGISEDRVDKVFKISEGYITQGTADEKGTGLGLILCKEFIEKNSGKIWVESTVGVGTAFYFSIPLAAEK